MRKNLRRMFVLTALSAVVSNSGCGGGIGPVTMGNLWNNYPPKVRRVAWVVPASVVVIDYQPTDTRQVDVDGWAIRSDTNFNNSNTPRIHLYWNLRDALDTVNGRGFFLLADQDWSGWGDGRPVLSTLDSYLLISVHDPDGQRIGVSLWKLAAGGGTSQVARTADSPASSGESVGKPVTMPIAEWQIKTPSDRLELAKQIMASR